MRTKMILSAVIMASMGLALACSSPAPEPRYYLMRGEASAAGSGRLDAPIRAGLGRLIVAPYLLSSKGVIFEVASGEVRPARGHQWAEPLDAGLRWFLRAEIGRVLGDEVGMGLVDRQDWDYTIDVFIARFHGTMSGTALLEATYAIRPAADSKPPREYQFSESRPLAEAGYAGLVAAQQGLAGELGAAIAQALQELIAAREPRTP